MKIAIIHNQISQSGGGMDRYFKQLVDGFAQRGDEVTVYVYKTDHSELNAQKKCYGIKLLGNRLNKIRFIKYMNKHFQPQEYDLSIGLTRTACQQISACGGTHAGYTQRMKQKLSRYDEFEINAEQQSFNHATWVMAHSDIIAEEIKTHYAIPDKKIHILYPPVVNMSETSSQQLQQASRKINLSKNHINILFPSIGHKVKNLDNLVTAIKKMPNNYQLWIVGSKPDIKELGDNIHYLGYWKDMAPLYKLMDYTILPSIYEAYGMVVLESISAGTPVIISNKVGCAPLISTQDGLIFSDITSEGIYQAILTAANSNYLPNQSICQDKGLTIEKHIAAINSISLI